MRCLNVSWFLREIILWCLNRTEKTKTEFDVFACQRTPEPFPDLGWKRAEAFNLQSSGSRASRTGCRSKQALLSASPSTSECGCRAAKRSTRNTLVATLLHFHFDPWRALKIWQKGINFKKNLTCQSHQITIGNRHLITYTGMFWHPRTDFRGSKGEPELMFPATEKVILFSIYIFFSPHGWRNWNAE